MARRRKRSSATSIPRTIQHLLTNKSGPDEYIPLPDIDVPQGRFPSRRLTWQRHELDGDIDRQVAKMINAPPNKDVILIPDANIFLAETSDVIWQEMFAAGNVFIPSQIMNEISYWLDAPKTNMAAHGEILSARARSQGSPVSILDVARINVPPESIEYYIRLLGLRKHAYLAAFSEYWTSKGREPNNQEISNWCKDNLGSRTQLLSGKGRKNPNSPNIFNDEAFVVMGIANAISSGRETMLITRDEDVLEQFYKAIYLVDTHFRSMLLANHYVEDPFAYFAKTVIDETSRAFEGEVKLLKKPSDTLRELLPTNFDVVGIHCLFMRSSYAVQLSFSADLGFREVFRIKGETHGLSTDRLDGANCHVSLGPLMQEWGDFAAIGKDRFITSSSNSFRFAMMDCNLSINSQETTRHNVGTEFAP